MREIKFRAYDPNIPNYGIRNLSIHELARFICFTTKDLVIQQYTGLKDMNGKEIYEGDIVKFEYENTEWHARIIFNQGRFDATWAPWELYYTEYFEVVGNIYENPDLLDK